MEARARPGRKALQQDMADQKKSMNRVARWGLVAALLVACGYAGLQIYSPPPPEVPTARVERRDFVVTIRGRGEVKSTNSATVTAPQTPDLRIARLAENGKPIRAGEVVVEFDPAAQEDQHLERQTEVRQAESEILQAKAQHSIADEQNSMLIMQSGYNVERAKLEASKQEILSEIEGLKNRINVTITEGELSMAETNAKATDLSQDADLARIDDRLEALDVADFDQALDAPRHLGSRQIHPFTQLGIGQPAIGLKGLQKAPIEPVKVWRRIHASLLSNVHDSCGC